MKFHAFFTVVSLLLTPLAAISAETEAVFDATDSIVRVNVSTQAYDFLRPWNKQAPQTRRAIGAVLERGRVLVSAELVANHTYVELEHPTTTARTPAKVLIADYSANLALVAPDDPDFLKSFTPLSLAEGVKVGDRLTVWQLEPNGTLLTTDALMTSVQISPYPMGDIALLMYSLTSALQGRDGSFTIPLIKDSTLAGIVIRHDTRTQNMNAIPVDVIRTFLENFDAGNYSGFPRVGITFSSTRDPQFRRFVGLDPDNGGVYVADVIKNGAGYKAGIQKGDVILSIDGSTIDQDGNYTDPQYGKLSLANLSSMRGKVGEALDFTLLREGEKLTLPVTLQDMPLSSYVSPPYLIDEAPRFIVTGGLVFQELSRQYLREWGGSWEESASRKLVYYDRFQNSLFPDMDRKIVFLSGVLPTPSSIGLGDLGGLVVTEVNGEQIRKLEDLRAALDKDGIEFHEIRFEDDPKIIFLSAEEAEATNRSMTTVYGLPALQNL